MAKNKRIVNQHTKAAADCNTIEKRDPRATQPASSSHSARGHSRGDPACSGCKSVSRVLLVHLRCVRATCAHTPSGENRAWRRCPSAGGHLPEDDGTRPAPGECVPWAKVISYIYKISISFPLRCALRIDRMIYPRRAMPIAADVAPAPAAAAAADGVRVQSPGSGRFVQDRKIASPLSVLFHLTGVAPAPRPLPSAIFNCFLFHL